MIAHKCYLADVFDDFNIFLESGLVFGCFLNNTETSPVAYTLHVVLYLICSCALLQAGDMRPGSRGRGASLLLYFQIRSGVGAK